MLLSLMHVLLAALCSSLLLVQVSGAPHSDVLIETLRADLTNDKDLTDLVFLKFMSELMAARGDVMLGELDEEEVEGSEQVLMRRRHLPLSQRERKAGCRNFFWKTFTSC